MTSLLESSCCEETRCKGDRSDVVNAPQSESDETEATEMEPEREGREEDKMKEPLSAKCPTLAQRLELQTGGWAEFGPSNHLKGCKWAPDGTCLLVCSADCKMRMYNLPTELYSGPVDHQLPDITPVLTLSLGETVYDYCWYPLMSSWQPETACMATTCKDHPVQLWDAFDLQKRASYSPHNQLDELVTPHSLCFSLDGQRLYCGFNKCVRVFETSRPGQECSTLPTHEKRWGGQSGIVSCIAMLPTHTDTYAVGSYSSQVGLYSALTEGAMLLLTGVGGGVTHIVFSADGNLLFVGFRKSSELKVWDIRNPGKQLAQLHRPVHTNQRLYFDLYRDRYLISGSADGQVLAWDTGALADVAPTVCYTVHSDPVTGCSVHPHHPLLATTSGQRHFPLPADSDDEDMAPDNSLKLWSLVDQSATVL